MRRYETIIRSRARERVFEISEHLKEDGYHSGADRILHDFYHCVASLESLPERYRRTKFTIEGKEVRGVHFGRGRGYRLFYFIEGRSVVVTYVKAGPGPRVPLA